MLYLYIILTILAFMMIIGIIVYIVIYNQNANKVLKTGRPNVLPDKGPIINFITVFGIIVLLVVILIQNINQKNQIQNLKQAIESLQGEVSHLRNRFSTLEDQFSNYLESQKNIYDFSYEIVDYNIEEKTIEVKVRFSMREINKNSTLSVQAVNVNDLDDVVTSEAFGSGNYNVILNLKINENYKLNLLEETDDQIKNSDLGRIYLEHLLKHDYKAEVAKLNDNHYLHIHYSNKNLPEAFNLNRVEFKVKNLKTEEIIYNDDVLNLLDKDDSKYYLELDDLIYFESGNYYNFEITLYNQFGILDSFEYDVRFN